MTDAAAGSVPLLFKGEKYVEPYEQTADPWPAHAGADCFSDVYCLSHRSSVLDEPV